MPHIERDDKQPGVYYFRKSSEELERGTLLERINQLESALAALQSREARDPPKVSAKEAVGKHLA